jgi:hypothetical protein
MDSLTTIRPKRPIRPLLLQHEAHWSASATSPVLPVPHRLKKYSKKNISGHQMSYLTCYCHDVFKVEIGSEVGRFIKERGNGLENNKADVERSRSTYSARKNTECFDGGCLQAYRLCCLKVLSYPSSELAAATATSSTPKPTPCPAVQSAPSAAASKEMCQFSCSRFEVKMATRAARDPAISECKINIGYIQKDR